MGILSRTSSGQSALEFLAMVSLSALILAALYGVMVSKQSQTLEYQNSRTAGRIAEYVSFQVEMALVQGDGYSRVFSLPENIAGQEYNVSVFNGTSQLSWGDSSAIRPSRYMGDEVRISTSGTNTFRVVNNEGEVKLVEE